MPAANSSTSTPSTPRQFQVGYGEQSSYTSPAGAYPFDSGSYGGFHAFGSYGAMPFQYGMPMAHSMNQNHGKQGNSPTSPSPVGSSQFMISNSSYPPMLASQQQRQSPQQSVNAQHGFAPAALTSAGAFSYSAVNNGRLAESPFPVTGGNDSLDLNQNNASPAASGGSDSSIGSSPGDASS